MPDAGPHEVLTLIFVDSDRNVEDTMEFKLDKLRHLTLGYIPGASEPSRFTTSSSTAMVRVPLSSRSCQLNSGCGGVDLLLGYAHRRIVPYHAAG